jgi:RimJ/RimL family protein N-acetyltransferase
MIRYNDETLAEVAALNELCFGEDDFYNKPERLTGCGVFLSYVGDTLVSYVLIKPGRISTLERYGVRPYYAGVGHGTQILRRALENYPVVTTYAAGTNGASNAALLKAGFFITGTDNGFITFMYLRDAG